MNLSRYWRVKAHNTIRNLFFLIILSAIVSCDKGDDYLDNSTVFPANWKAIDSFSLVTYNVKDTLGNFMNATVAPLGTTVDANFGTIRASFYASYQTTLSSKSFSFTSVDSIVLVLPYYSALPKYGTANNPIDIEVFELTEALETSTTSKKNTYAHSSSALGGRYSYIPLPYDSVQDGASKSAPSIRIPLALSFANKLLAPGSYSDDVAFQSVLKGLYIKSSSNTNTNGYVLLSTSLDNKIKIYGKNASGESITSEFVTGGSNCITVNEYLHDPTSLAASTTSSANSTSGDAILYNAGLFGYYNKLKLPDLKKFAVDKNIFKAELSFYLIDSGLTLPSSIGMLYVDTIYGKEYALPDEYYSQKYLISIKDTLIGSYRCKEYKYNIGYFVNRILESTIYSKEFNIYSAPVSIGNNSTTKLSSFLPSRIIMGGSGQATKPKLKIYYTDK